MKPKKQYYILAGCAGFKDRLEMADLKVSPSYLKILPQDSKQGRIIHRWAKQWKKE